MTFTSRSLSTEPSGSFAKAELVGAKTVKGGSRLVPLGKAMVMAASRVEGVKIGLKSMKNGKNIIYYYLYKSTLFV